MNSNILIDIIKYVILTVAIYSVLKYALNYNLNNFDTIITTTILVLLIILAETLYKMYVKENFSENDKLNYCSSVCGNIEGMADLPSTEENHAKAHHHHHHKKTHHNKVHGEHSKAHHAKHGKIHSESKHSKVHGEGKHKKGHKHHKSKLHPHSEAKSEEESQQESQSESQDNSNESKIGGQNGGQNGGQTDDMNNTDSQNDMDKTETPNSETDMEDNQLNMMIKQKGNQMNSRSNEDMNMEPAMPTGKGMIERQLYAGQMPMQQKQDRNDGRGMIMKASPGKYKQPAGVERNGDRYEEGTLDDEYDYNDYNILPMADHDTGNFEYGYSFLPPDKWYPQPPNPPVCVTDKRLHVMPIYTTGTPIDVKEWNDARRITPPDNIKTKYVKEKLNSGR